MVLVDTMPEHVALGVELLQVMGVLESSLESGSAALSQVLELHDVVDLCLLLLVGVVLFLDLLDGLLLT